MSSQSFADLGVSQVVVRALAQRDRHKPFAVQSTVIPDVLAGRDVLAKAPTGSGKTLGLRRAPGRPPGGLRPARRQPGAGSRRASWRARSSRSSQPLMAARSLSIAAVYGGAGIEPQAKRARRAHVVVATPGRLEDLIQRGDIRLDRVRILVLDEADRMLDMGFRPLVDRIVAQTPSDRQTLFFSATLEGAAGKVAAQYTRDPARHEQAVPAQAKGKVEHRFVSVSHDAKLGSLLGELKHDRTAAARWSSCAPSAEPTGWSSASAATASRPWRCTATAASPSARRRWAASTTARSTRLVATDVAARGIDVDDITHVINFDAPEDRDAYVHRVGRTGRAGRTGVGHHLRARRPGPRHRAHRRRPEPRLAVRRERTDRSPGAAAAAAQAPSTVGSA